MDKPSEEALRAILKVQANENSEPDAMAEALVQMRAIARDALKRAVPPDPEGQNDARAEWAGSALRFFQRSTGTDHSDALSDLLCNLLHWCDRNGLDFERELERGKCHYDEETTDHD